MRNINDVLENKYSDQGAYKVPEGYFDTLNDRIMANIPSEQRKPMRFLLFSRVRYVAAACAAVAVTGVGMLLYSSHQNSEREQQLAAEAQLQERANQQYAEDCMEYAMVGKDDCYKYLADQ